MDRDFDQAAQLIEKMKGSEDNGFAYAHRPVPVECYLVLVSRLRDEPLRALRPKTRGGDGFSAATFRAIFLIGLTQG